jgi:hypothetical protein
MTASFHKPTRQTGLKPRPGFAVRKDRGSLKGKLYQQIKSRITFRNREKMMNLILSFPFQIIQRGKVVMGVFKSLFISLPIYIRDQKISQRESFGFPVVAETKVLSYKWTPANLRMKFSMLLRAFIHSTIKYFLLHPF